jgi:O-antigen ligase
MSAGSPRRARLLAGAAAGMTLLAILVSGSRTPLVLLAGAVALLVLLSRAVTRLTAVALVIVVVLAYAFSFLGPGVRERFASIAAYEHVERFQRTYFGQLFLPELLEEPLGSGLGTATIGARHVSEFREVELVESYLGILAVETGIPGVATFLWLAGAIGVAVMRQRRAVRGRPEAVLWHALAVYVLFTLLILPVSTVIDHAPSNLYFWFSVGALLRAADLARASAASAPAGRGRRASVR